MWSQKLFLVLVFTICSAIFSCCVFRKDTRIHIVCQRHPRTAWRRISSNSAFAIASRSASLFTSNFAFSWKTSLHSFCCFIWWNCAIRGRDLKSHWTLNCIKMFCVEAWSFSVSFSSTLDIFSWFKLLYLSKRRACKFHDIRDVKKVREWSFQSNKRTGLCVLFFHDLYCFPW